MEWITRHPDCVEGFKRESCFTLEYSRDRILHAVGQLNTDQLWWRPDEAMHAVGNIVLHVCGNLRQWIVCGVGGLPDDRDRPAEFAHREPIASDVLAVKLGETVKQASAAIMAVTEAELMRPRFVQITRVTGLGAIYHSVAHLEGHAQEIIYIARLQLRGDYRFKNEY